MGKGYVMRVHLVGDEPGRSFCNNIRPSPGLANDNALFTTKRSKITCAPCKRSMVARWRTAPAPQPLPSPTILVMKGGETGEDDCGGPVAYLEENGLWSVPRSQPESRAFDCDLLDWYRSPLFSVLRDGVPWCPAPTPEAP